MVNVRFNDVDEDDASWKFDKVVVVTGAVVVELVVAVVGVPDDDDGNIMDKFTYDGGSRYGKSYTLKMETVNVASDVVVGGWSDNMAFLLLCFQW